MTKLFGISRVYAVFVKSDVMLLKIEYSLIGRCEKEGGLGTRGLVMSKVQ